MERHAFPCACLLLLLGAGPGIAGDAARPLTLEGAVDRALSHNRDLMGTALAARTREAEIARAQADFAYRLTPAGNAGFTDDGESLAYGLSLSRKLPWGTTVAAGGSLAVDTGNGGAADRYTGRWRVQVDQPLFRNAGALPQREPLRQARSRHRQSLRLLETTRADLVLDVVERYEHMLALQRSIDADASALPRLEKLRRLTEARSRQGRATPLDVMRVDLQHGQAAARLENAREQLAAQQRALAEQLGDAPDTTYVLAAPPRIAIDVPDADEAAAAALSNRLDYAQALEDQADAARGKRIARRALWPDLNLTARLEQSATENNASDALAGGETAWFVGVSGDAELLAAADRTALRQAALGEEAAQLDIEIVRVRIVRQVKDQLGAYARAQQEAEIASRNVSLAERRLQLAMRLFEKGRADNIAVTDAEEALQLAEDARVTTEAEASVAGYRVFRATGTLIAYPDDLKPAAL
jgi:outer membrane protein TolC